MSNKPLIFTVTFDHFTGSLKIEEKNSQGYGFGGCKYEDIPEKIHEYLERTTLVKDIVKKLQKGDNNNETI